MCKPVKMPPSLDGAALACGSTPEVAPVTLSESLALDTWPPRAAAAVIPPTRMATATVTDNFRNPPSTPDTLFSNPMSLLPKIPGRSPWPGVLVRFGGSRTALLHGFGADVSTGTAWIGLSLINGDPIFFLVPPFSNG